MREGRYKRLGIRVPRVALTGFALTATKAATIVRTRSKGEAIRGQYPGKPEDRRVVERARPFMGFASVAAAAGTISYPARLAPLRSPPSKAFRLFGRRGGRVFGFRLVEALSVDPAGLSLLTHKIGPLS